ncbi:methylmalonyl-CoA mutase family protein [Chryseomicrobium palamuruense]|uniref:Methylmalonyl-CoA mutase family protein n=1 Tax=Chryseomicrobium palamuruense TaxID=682973 RepID=A0ABV8V068_9BACL
MTESTFDNWKDLVKASLKGKEWNALQTGTAEGITLEPLYTTLTTQQQNQSSRVIASRTQSEVAFLKALTSVHVDVREAHKRGADAATELLSFLIDCDAYMTQHQQLPKTAAFAVDTHFFMEIAKLRAARLLWANFSDVHAQKDAPLQLVAETSLRSYSLYDPHVNLLRSANSAFAAVLGGAEAVHVYPFDCLTGGTGLGQRLAENVLEIIRHESLVTEVLDPAGGSYSIEALTENLAKSVWEQFQNIMDLPSDERTKQLEEKITKAYIFLANQTAIRAHSLIGTTIYANPKGAVAEIIQDFGYVRLAEPYETLRAKLQPLAQRVAIVQTGSLKESKPRVDFVKGFLSTFGWDAPVFDSMTTTPETLLQQGVTYAVLVGPDESIEEVVPKWLNNGLILDVAGKHSKTSDWQDQGLNGSIFLGQSLIEKGQELVDALQIKGAFE